MVAQNEGTTPTESRGHVTNKKNAVIPLSQSPQTWWGGGSG